MTIRASVNVILRALLHQRSRLFVADRLDNIPSFIEHLDFRATHRSKPGKRLQPRKLPSRLAFSNADCVTNGPE
jgi:hypothetical protein